MSATPGPWWVRTRVTFGEIRDCFVAAKDVQGMAYDAEILGDDEYREGIDRKLADAYLIAAAPDLLAALRGIIEIGKRDMSNPKYDGFFEFARAAIAKAVQP